MTTRRQEIITHFSRLADSGKPFWGVGASRQDDAAAAVAGGASWLVASHAGGLDPKVPASVIGLLPYADANSETLSLGGMAASTAIPVIAGVFAVDQFRIMSRFLKDIKAAGFDAVQNFPSVGLAEGKFKSFLAEAELGYKLEVEMIGLARELDLFASAVVFNPEQAEAAIAAGADMLVFHPGLTADGEYRHWNASAKNRLAAVADVIPAGRSGMILARFAFDLEDGPVAGADSRVGVQYDRNPA